jgi:hypothetical protein
MGEDDVTRKLENFINVHASISVFWGERNLKNKKNPKIKPSPRA